MKAALAAVGILRNCVDWVPVEPTCVFYNYLCMRDLATVSIGNGLLLGIKRG